MQENLDKDSPRMDYDAILRLKSTLMDLGLIHEQEFDWGTGYAVTQTGSGVDIRPGSHQGTSAEAGEVARRDDGEHRGSLLDCILREIREKG
jgi:hypothetical protein